MSEPNLHHVNLFAKVYVDDLTLLVQGATNFVVKTMADILNFVVDYFEGTLMMTVSKKKSKVIASKPSVAMAIADRVDQALLA